MKKLQNNLNPVSNPVTTISGFLLLCGAIALKIIPMFMEVKQQMDDLFIYGVGILGLCLLIIPDAIGDALRSVLKRKSETI